MLHTEYEHHESLLTQLLLTGSLVLPVARLAIKARAAKMNHGKAEKATAGKEAKR